MSSSDPGQNPYEQNPAPPPYQQQAPYGQVPYGQAPYGQPPYGSPASAYPGYLAVPPKHPSATTAMVLGIIGLAGFLTCGLTLVLSPFAWVIGRNAVRDIDAAPPGTYSARDQANAGRVTGIIGTVVLIVGVVLLLGFIGLMVGVSSVDSGT